MFLSKCSLRSIWTTPPKTQWLPAKTRPPLSAMWLNKIQIWPWDFLLHIPSSTNSLTINFIVPYLDPSWTGNYFLMWEPMGLVLVVIIGSPESMPYRQNPGLASRYISMCLLVIFGDHQKIANKYICPFKTIGGWILWESSRLSIFANVRFLR